MTHSQFVDWFNKHFGFSHGMGEEPILTAFKMFFSLCKPEDGKPTYNFAELEEALGPTVTWLLINFGNNCGWIDYRSNPRWGFLEGLGEELKEYFTAHSVADICQRLRRDWTLTQ